MRKATGDTKDGFLFPGGKGAFAEEIAMPEKIRNLCLQAFLLQGCFAVRRGRRAPSLQFRLLAFQVLAHLRHSMDDGLVDLLDDMELADLMRNIAEDRGNRLGVQRGAVAGDAQQRQTARRQSPLEAPEKPLDVPVRGVAVEHLVQEPPVPAIVYDGEYAEGAVVQFICRDVAGEIGERVVQIGRSDLLFSFFSPSPRPSFGWWRRGQRRDGRAISARMRRGRASHPPRPAARTSAPRGGYTEHWGLPGR